MHRCGLALAVATLLVTVPAFAEGPVDAASPGPPAFVPAPPPAPAEPDGTSDHDRLVHHLAVGYFGASLLPIAVPPSGPGAPPTGGSITAPALGVRYWLTRRFGIDAAIGVGFNSGSETVDGQSTATATTFGMDFHAGVPIALVSASHYVFEVVPETLVG